MIAMLVAVAVLASVLVVWWWWCSGPGVGGGGGGGRSAAVTCSRVHAEQLPAWTALDRLSESKWDRQQIKGGGGTGREAGHN